MSSDALARLEQRVAEIGALRSKLLLLVGAPHTGKTALLSEFSVRIDTKILNAGSELGHRLAAVPQKQRHLKAAAALRELAQLCTRNDVLLLDNIELLFDTSLQLDPLDLLKRHALCQRVVAVWPGEFKNKRLIYAGMAHPEHRDYSAAGLVTMEIS